MHTFARPAARRDGDVMAKLQAEIDCYKRALCTPSNPLYTPSPHPLRRFASAHTRALPLHSCATRWRSSTPRSTASSAPYLATTPRWSPPSSAGQCPPTRGLATKHSGHNPENGPAQQALPSSDLLFPSAPRLPSPKHPPRPLNRLSSLHYLLNMLLLLIYYYTIILLYYYYTNTHQQNYPNADSPRCSTCSTSASTPTTRRFPPRVARRRLAAPRRLRCRARGRCRRRHRGCCRRRHRSRRWCEGARDGGVTS